MEEISTKYEDDNKTFHVEHIVLKEYPEIVCFESIHILHVVVSYFVILLLLFLNVIMIKCFYESRINRSFVAKYVCVVL